MKKNIKYFFPFVCLAAVFILCACGKKWKKPVAVTYTFQLNSNSNSGLVKFTDAYLVLNKVSFKGERNQGTKEVELEQRFDNNLPLSFSAATSSPGIKFDIPQGTYTKIETKFDINTDQNGYSLQIDGTYTDALNNNVSVQFTFPVPDAITITSKNSSGGNEIVLVDGHPVTATIIMNPNYWFAVISETMMDNSVQHIVGGVPTIQIDKDNNKNTYDLILGRIKDGNQCVFN